MTRIDLPYVHRFRDRHGKVRHYFRRPRFKQMSLPGRPGNEEFMAAYQAAMASQEPAPPIGSNRTKPGTVNAAVVGYLQSVAFLRFSVTTQKNYRGVLNRFRAEHGDKRVATLEQRHVNGILAGMIDIPDSANHLVKVLRGLMQWCVAERWRNDDPTAGLKNMPTHGDGFLVWEEDQVAKFRAKHALGTRARLALEILASTGLRRSDVVRLGRQHVKGGTISIKTQKTNAQIDIPVLPELTAAIDAMSANSAMTFLVTEYGKSFTAAGFGQWFRHRCDEAGITKGYAAHGLRKFAATRLAEEGATASQLMSWFGWATLAEAEHYTKAADRKKMARAAGALLIKGTAQWQPR